MCMCMTKAALHSILQQDIYPCELHLNCFAHLQASISVSRGRFRIPRSGWQPCKVFVSDTFYVFIAPCLLFNQEFVCRPLQFYLSDCDILQTATAQHDETSNERDALRLKCAEMSETHNRAAGVCYFLLIVCVFESSIPYGYKHTLI